MKTKHKVKLCISEMTMIRGMCRTILGEGKKEKLAPYGTDGRLLRNLRPFQVRSHVTQKLGQISKIWSIQNLDIVP